MNHCARVAFVLNPFLWVSHSFRSSRLTAASFLCASMPTLYQLYYCIIIKTAVESTENYVINWSSQFLSQFLESDQRRVFSEALATDVQTILPDQPVSVWTHSALARALTVIARMWIPHFLMTHPSGELDIH